VPDELSSPASIRQKLVRSGGERGPLLLGRATGRPACTVVVNVPGRIIKRKGINFCEVFDQLFNRTYEIKYLQVSNYLSEYSDFTFI